MTGSPCVPNAMRIHRLSLLFLALLTGIACAQARQATALEKALASVPADVDVCLSVSDASALRATPAGRFVEQALGTFAGGDNGAFERLLSSLGLPRDEAFDLLFGRGVILVSRTGADGVNAWAVRCEVSRSTLDALRRALEPSPRDAVRGRPIYSVERGRFSLAFERTRGGATLLLAPSSGEALLKEMLSVPEGNGLLGREVFPNSGAALAQADALFFADLGRVAVPEASGQLLEAEPRWIALAANTKGRTVSISARLQAPDIAGPAEVPFRPWATQRFEELGEDALLVMLDRTNNDVLETLLGDSANGVPGLLPFPLPVEVRALATHRAAAIVRKGAGDTLEGALALETDDVRALADAIDTAMPGLLGSDASYAGLPISAMRSTRILAPTPLLGKGGEARFAWNFRVHAECNDDQETGWWSVGLGASTVSQLGRSLVTEVDASNAPDLPWLGMGLVRPAELVSLATNAGLRLGEEGALLSRVELLKWHEIRTGSDSSIAAMTLRLTDDDGASPKLLSPNDPVAGER